MTATMNNEKRSWYLVFTKSKSELKAQENLFRQGYETYLPLVQHMYRRKGRNVKCPEVFFSRYLFIHLDKETDNWAPIRSTLGVASMVSFGGLPAVVPEKMIEDLKKNEDEFGLQTIEQNELKAGDCVEIIDGSFEGCKAFYQDIKSLERASVLLDIVGKNTQVILSIHDVKRA